MIINNELISNHIIQRTFPLDESIKELVRNEKWQDIDNYFLNIEKKNGLLFNYLSDFLEFNSIEHIISIRNPPHDEDGIWHDDGSRILGFTLSLTENPDSIIGGDLLFKHKESKDFQRVSIRPFGEILLFKTGIYGFEHMVTKVTQGKRILIAGWCS